MQNIEAQQIWTNAIVPIMSACTLMPMVGRVRWMIQGGVVISGAAGQKDVKVIGESPYQIDSADPDYEKRWKKLAEELVAVAIQANSPVIQNPRGTLTGFCDQSNQYLSTRWVVTVITECNSPLIAKTLAIVVINILELYTQWQKAES